MTILPLDPRHLALIIHLRRGSAWDSHWAMSPSEYEQLVEFLGRRFEQIDQRFEQVDTASISLPADST